MKQTNLNQANIFIYDDDCGFCSKFVNRVRKEKLSDVQILSRSTVDKAYQAMLQESSIFLVCPDTDCVLEGEVKPTAVYTHNESIGHLLQCSSSWMSRGVGRIFCSKLFSKFFKQAYILIAKNRHLISRILSTGGSCSLSK